MSKKLKKKLEEEVRLMIGEKGWVVASNKDLLKAVMPLLGQIGKEVEKAWFKHYKKPKCPPAMRHYFNYLEELVEKVK